MDFGISIGGFNPTDPFGDTAQKRAKTAAKDSFKRSIHARRTEYQDKVMSLEAAGLNRILAAGGQPTGVNAPQAAVNPTKGEARISQLEAAQADLMQATAKKTHLESQHLESELNPKRTRDTLQNSILKGLKDAFDMAKQETGKKVFGLSEKEADYNQVKPIPGTARKLKRNYQVGGKK